MRYRHLGRSGIRVSVVGLGCNRLGRTVDQAGTTAIVHRALDEGINFLDTADAYGNKAGDSETVLGHALVGERHRVVIATKVRARVGEGPNDEGASRYHIQNGVEASLRRLRTDYLDVYYIHSWDPETPIEETLRALEDLVRSGKVRYIGASNFVAWQLCRANGLAEMMKWNSFSVVQAHYHMLRRDIEHELIPYCRYAQIGMVPYYPLAGGFLTGKYQRGQILTSTRAAYVQPYITEPNFATLDELRAFTERRGHILGELAIAWLLGEPQVCSVIAGVTAPEQLTANARASEWVLSQEELAEIRKILQNTEE